MVTAMLSSKPTPQAPSVAQSPSVSVGPMLTGARILLECLVAEQVDTIFGYPGGVILPIYDALVDYPSLKHILVRHEQGATHMAEGYARACGKPGVVLVTSGPGATNIVTGVADAYYDSVPLVVLTGNVPSHLMGNDAFQEADILGITRACTKHNTIVRNVADLPLAIKEAFHIATTGRPGPVVVDLPKDVLLAATEFLYPSQVDLPGYDLTEHYTQGQLEQVLRLLETAERPVILAGGGVITADACDPLQAFAEALQLPVANTLMGLGSFPVSHPLSLHFSGMHGHYWTNIAIANADVLLVIGSRLNDRQTGKTDRFAKNATIVHIDLDPTSLQKNVEACIPIQGNIAGVLQGLLAKLDASPSSRFSHTLSTRPQWMAQIDGWKTRRERPQFPEGFLSPQFVIERLFHWLPKDGPHQGMVTTEVGQHQMWAAQHFSLSAPRSFITSGGLGTMGFGFPAALGMQMAYPDRTIVDIAGDGSFQMTLQELATAMDYKLPVKVAIINNSHLGMIRQWQGKQFGRLSQASMSSPDYIQLASAYGGTGYRITHPDQVDSIIQEAYAITDRPVIMDFRVHERTDVYPWVPSGGANDEMLVEEDC
jgi:acetolactate synthase I/II/III large subunit